VELFEAHVEKHQVDCNASVLKCPLDLASVPVHSLICKEKVFDLLCIISMLVTCFVAERLAGVNIACSIALTTAIRSRCSIVVLKMRVPLSPARHADRKYVPPDHTATIILPKRCVPSTARDYTIVHLDKPIVIPNTNCCKPQMSPRPLPRLPTTAGATGPRASSCMHQQGSDRIVEGKQLYP
jgi:hypothetical protein